MKNIETHTYRTPASRESQDTTDYWSIGILNMTRKETDLVGAFARRLNAERSLTATEASDAARLSLTMARIKETELALIRQSLAPTQETAPTINDRFQGLDIG